MLICFCCCTGIDVPPLQIYTSVDNYKCVCPGEKVYVTCSARNSRSLSWTSPDYIGQTAAIEFSQNFDRPGEGKLVSLPNGRSSHIQVMQTEPYIMSDLKITIPRDLNETQITCTNKRRASVTKSLLLSRGKQIMLLGYNFQIIRIPWALLRNYTFSPSLVPRPWLFLLGTRLFSSLPSLSPVTPYFVGDLVTE